MSRAVSASTGRTYGLARVAGVWGIARSTVYGRRKRELMPLGARPGHGKRGPKGPLSDEGLVALIRRELAESPFHGEGHRKVWARLRCRGIRTSKERVLRLMRENGLLAVVRKGNPHGPKAHDRSIITECPDQMWGADMTTTMTIGEGVARVFVAVDHSTCECVGVHAARSGNRFEALEPIRQGVREHFGAFSEGVAEGLALRHDHGSAYMSDDFQREITFLGMRSSPAFVKEPEGNGCAERFIRTLKENLLWVRPFATIEQLRLALLEFKELYNERWLIERLGYRTPAQARRMACKPVEKAA